MNESFSLPPIPAPVPYKDRRAGLVAFGILEMLFGGLAALMVPLMILGQFMAAQNAPEAANFRQMIPGMIFYAIAAITLISLGVGSCQARRWARALSLVVSWSWLLLGVVMLAMMAIFLPRILNVPAPGGQAMPDSARTIATIVMLGFIGVFFVVVPGVFVLFYRSPYVKATCDVRDPVPRWTDACPLPVLALSLWLGFSAVSMLFMIVSANGVMPVFGMLISGVFGALLWVALAVILGYAAWSVYRLKPAGWWIVLVLICLGMASAFITFMQIDILEMYRRMGYPEQQIEMLKQYDFLMGRSMAFAMLAGAIPILGFFVFVKRYFRTTVS